MEIDYTVEMTTVPVLDDDWSRFYELLDMFPGTILLEDPIEPSLIFSVRGDQDEHVYSFVRLVATIAGITYTKISVALADRVDFDYDNEEYAELA